jgi:K+-transporting ATPase ATPase C chain
MRRDLVTSLIAAVAFTLLFGIGYPLVTTGIARLAFPNKADGSRVELAGKTVGSRIVGQDFRRAVVGRDGTPEVDADGNPVLAPDARYFQSRPSATGYTPNVTYFNNLGPNSRDLAQQFRQNLASYLKLERPYNPDLRRAGVPVDAVTTSGSGVDPHISERNAEIQARRIAQVRRLPLDRVLELVQDNTDDRSLGLFGEPGVNMLELNLALDAEAGA